MSAGAKLLEHGLGRPLANASFAMMHACVKSMQRWGIDMVHTARPFSYYRKVFYHGRQATAVLNDLQHKRVLDVGCGYTPFAEDSMFRACAEAGVEFYGIDPLLERDIRFGLRERALARATGGSGRFDPEPPRLDRALANTAQDLPFADASVDEILCSYLLFVWIKDEQTLADILGEFHRVLRPGTAAKLYPLHEWRFMRIRSKRLQDVLARFELSQHFVHGHGDWRVTPGMMTMLRKA